MTGRSNTMGTVSRRRFLGLTAGAAGGPPAGLGRVRRPAGRRPRRATFRRPGPALRIHNWADYIDPDDPVRDRRSASRTPPASTVDLRRGVRRQPEAFADGGLPANSSRATAAATTSSCPPTGPSPASSPGAGSSRSRWNGCPTTSTSTRRSSRMPWDRGARFHMPWQAGLTGIAYNPALTGGTPVTSVAQLFEPALKGRVGHGHRDAGDRRPGHARPGARTRPG